MSTLDKEDEITEVSEEPNIQKMATKLRHKLKLVNCPTGELISRRTISKIKLGETGLPKNYRTVLTLTVAAINQELKLRSSHFYTPPLEDYTDKREYDCHFYRKRKRIEVAFPYKKKGLK